MTPEDRNMTLTENLRDQMRREGFRVEPIAEDGNASGGFIDGCDDYQGHAFVAWKDDREYYVTVEDVTPAKEGDE